MLQVSVAMMAKGYVSQMTLITKEILEQGRADAGASISGEMLKNGNLDFVKIWNEARKADEGEVEKDPQSVKDQLKDAVGSVVGNAKGMMLTITGATAHSPSAMPVCPLLADSCTLLSDNAPNRISKSPHIAAICTAFHIMLPLQEAPSNQFSPLLHLLLHGEAQADMLCLFMRTVFYCNQLIIKTACLLGVSS